MLEAYIGALILGVVLIGIRCAPLFVGNINAELFAEQIVKLIRADNVDRALKLCAAVPRAYFCRMVAPLLKSAGEIDTSLGASLVREELDVRFYRERKAQLRRARSRSWLTLLGVLLSGGGAAGLVLDSSAPPQAGLAGLVALLVAIWSLRVVAKISKDSEEQGKRITSALSEWCFSTSGKPSKPPAAAPAPTQAGTAPDRQAMTLRIREPNGNERVETFNDPFVKIGSLENSHLRLDDDKVSRMHAVIEQGEDETMIIDLGSAAGTLINGERVNKGVLRSGDEIQLGNTSIVVSAVR